MSSRESARVVKAAQRPADRPRPVEAPPGTKLAEAVAGRIVADIVAAGWPVGDVLGSETALLERYGISRAVFREAARLLELQHVARMRRGPGGGLVVSSPSADIVVDAASVYLYFVRAGVDEVFEARTALESAATTLATARLDEHGIGRLRDLVSREQAGEIDDYRDFHSLVASIADNPALELFVDVLNRATFLYLPYRSRVRTAAAGASIHAHEAIAEAILSGRSELASARMRKHLAAEAGFLRRKRHATMTVPAIGRTEKLPEVTARAILDDVAAVGWPVGRLLGSEAQLMERYGISRAVLRESVRLLEHHQIAAMRRGPGGGLFVVEPGVDATTDAFALLVEQRRITSEQLFEVRAVVEMVVLDRVLDQIANERDGAIVARLRASQEFERSLTPEQFAVVGHDLHDVLAEASGNRVLQLLTHALLRMTRLHMEAPPDAPDPIPTGDVIRVHDRIIEAIIDGDRELAKHRARRHLDALVHWSR